MSGNKGVKVRECCVLGDQGGLLGWLASTRILHGGCPGG